MNFALSFLIVGESDVKKSILELKGLCVCVCMCVDVTMVIFVCRFLVFIIQTTTKRSFRHHSHFLEHPQPEGSTTCSCCE